LSRLFDRVAYWSAPTAVLRLPSDHKPARLIVGLTTGCQQQRNRADGTLSTPYLGVLLGRNRFFSPSNIEVRLMLMQ